MYNYIDLCNTQKYIYVIPFSIYYTILSISTQVFFWFWFFSFSTIIKVDLKYIFKLKKTTTLPLQVFLP